MKDVAQRARDAGIEIFAIGVGRVDMGTLRQMASDPLDDHVDYVESYSVIEKLTKKFQEAFCGKLGRGDTVAETSRVISLKSRESLSGWEKCKPPLKPLEAGPIPVSRVRCSNLLLPPFCPPPHPNIPTAFSQLRGHWDRNNCC